MAREQSDSSEHISIPVNITDYPFAFSCWGRADGVATIDGSVGLVNKATGPTDRTRAHIRYYAGKFDVEFQNDGNYTLVTGPAETTDVWHNLVLNAISETKREFWVDGVKVATQTDSHPINVAFTSFEIGSIWSHTSSGMDVAEAGLWGRALTDSEISLLSSGLTPDQVGRADLISYTSLLNSGVQEIGPAATNTNYVKIPHPAEATKTLDDSITFWKSEPKVANGVYNLSAIASIFSAGQSRRFDVLGIYDSNGFFNTSYGHYYGLQKALKDKFGPLYATGVLPVDPNGSWGAQINGIDPGAVTEPGSALPAFLEAYNLDSGLGIDDWMDKPYLYLADGDSIASGTVFNVNAINHTNDINDIWGFTDTTHPNMKWHMVMGTFASGTGYCRPGVRNWNSLTYQAQEASDIDPNTGSDGIVDYEITIPAGTRGSSNGLQFVLHRVTQDSLEGPFFATHQRVEFTDQDKGPSCHIGLYQGGLSAYDACRACKDTAETAIAEYLRQCVKLQTGDPLLIVQIVHGGNDRDESASSWNSATEAFDLEASYTAEGFANNVEGIRYYFREAWRSLGYADSGLAFLVGPYHPQAGDQTINSILKSKVEWNSDYYDAVIVRRWKDTTVIKGTEITTVSEMTTNSEYDGGGDAHLTQVGYENHSQRWLDKLFDSPPDPRSKDFLAWMEMYIAQQEALAPISRTTTKYITIDKGGDSSGGGGAGTEIDPWLVATWDDVATLIAANLAEDTAFLLKRGDEFIGTSELLIDTNNVTVGAYGTGDKPLIHHFTETGTTGWTLVSGTTYRRDVTNDVGWVREIADRLSTTPLCHVNSSGDVGTAITNAAGTWWWGDDSGTNRLYVDIGQDPTGLLEWALFDDTNDAAILLDPASTGVRVDNIRAEGWGLEADGGSSTQRHALKSQARDSTVHVFSDCESYFGSSHVFAHNGGGNPAHSGGICSFIDCKAGWTTDNGASGETIFNAYVYGGNHKVTFDGCEVVAGTLPNTTTPVSQGRGFYGHTSAGNDAGLYLCRNCAIRDTNWSCEDDALWANCPTGGLADIRAFTFGMTATMHEATQSPTTSSGTSASAIRANCNITAYSNDRTPQAYLSGNPSGYCWNNVFTLDLSETLTKNKIALWNPTAATTVTMWNNHFRVIGNGGISDFVISYDGATYGDGDVIQNNIFTAENMGVQTAELNEGNNLVNPGNIAANGYFGWTGADDTTTDDGYGNDLAAYEFGNMPTILDNPSTDLINAGTYTGLEYDINGNERFVSSIGPVAADEETVFKGKVKQLKWQDESGNDNHMVMRDVKDVPDSTIGPYGTHVAVFDGTDMHGETGIDTTGWTAITMVAWIKTSYSAARQAIFGQAPDTPMLAVETSGELRVWANSIGASLTTSGQSLDDDVWHFVGGSFDESDDIAYAVVDDGYDTSGTLTASQVQNVLLKISEFTGGQRINGAAAYFALFNTRLSVAQMQNLQAAADADAYKTLVQSYGAQGYWTLESEYKTPDKAVAQFNLSEGRSTDASGHNLNGSLIGSPVVTSLSSADTSQQVHRDILTFDGTTDEYLDISANKDKLASNKGTFVCRVRIPSTQADTDTIASFRNDSTGEYFSISTSSTGHLTIIYDDDGTGVVSQIDRSTTTDDDKWHTLAVEWGLGGYVIYFDGAPDTDNWSASTGSMSDEYGPHSITDADQVYIGKFSDANPNLFEGDISEVKFFDRHFIPGDHAKIHESMLTASRYVLILGDDNAVSSETGSATPSSALVVADDGTTVVKAAEPLNHQSQVAGSVGFGINYANRAIGRLTAKQQFRLVPCGQTGATTSQWLDRGTYHDSAKTRWNSAWNRGNTQESEVDVIVISLGSNDITDAQTAAAVQANMTSIINHLRTSGDWEGMETTTPVVILGVSAYTLAQSHADVMDAGLRAAAAALQNCTYVNLSDLADGGDKTFESSEMPKIADRIELNRTMAVSPASFYGSYRPTMRLGAY